jgi:hypothetical protein
VKLLAIVLKDSAKLGAYYSYRHPKELQEDDQLLSLVRRVLVETEAAQVALTKLLPADTAGLAILPVRSPSTTLGLSPNIVVTAEIPISYSHTSVLDHAPQIIKEEKLQPRNKQGQSPQARIKAHQEKGRKTGDIVYERGRARYNREHLQATSGTLAKLLIDAVKNPDDALSSAAVQALGGFAEEAVKIRGISANSAAQEYNVPTNFLLRWAKQVGVIPILSEGIGPGSPIFLDREKAQEAANIYHEAKRQGIQPLKLLERTASSRF